MVVTCFYSYDSEDYMCLLKWLARPGLGSQFKRPGRGVTVMAEDHCSWDASVPWEERLGTGRCCGSTHPLTGVNHPLIVVMYIVNQGLDIVDSRVEE